MIIVLAFVFCLGLAACGSDEGSSSKENPVANVEQTENSTNRNEGQGKEDDGWSSDDFQGPWTKTFESEEQQDAIGWDGEWSGGDVKVIICLADNYVMFSDAEMHNADCDEVSVEGNVITAIYRITLGMYDNPDTYMLPEQEWTIVMEKNGSTINYSRTTILTYFDYDAEGNRPESVEKTSQATLTKVNKWVGRK